MNILIVSWDSAGLRLCETTSQDVANRNREGVWAKISNKKPCVAPAFLKELGSYAQQKEVSLFIVGTQDESKYGSYLHSDALPEAMQFFGFRLLKSRDLDGVGIDDGHGVPTGKPFGVSLRTSIYVVEKKYEEFHLQERALRRFFKNDGHLDYHCENSKGALASYVWHPDLGHHAFINLYLPSAQDQILVGKTPNYFLYREQMKSINRLCLINILNTFVNNIEAAARPDFVYLFGNFNSNIDLSPYRSTSEALKKITENLSVANLRQVIDREELSLLMREPTLKGFVEGENGAGPTFAPTWRLARNRDESCATGKDTSCYNIDTSEPYTSSIGWRDRILSSSMGDNNLQIRCLEYLRHDNGGLEKSTHSAVSALLRLA
jgi:hypothetical protein